MKFQKPDYQVPTARRRAQVGDILSRTSYSLQCIAEINSDILTIEETTRIVSLALILDELAKSLSS